MKGGPAQAWDFFACPQGANFDFQGGCAASGILKIGLSESGQVKKIAPCGGPAFSKLRRN